MMSIACSPPAASREAGTDPCPMIPLAECNSPRECRRRGPASEFGEPGLACPAFFRRPRVSKCVRSPRGRGLELRADSFGGAFQLRIQTTGYCGGGTVHGAAHSGPPSAVADQSPTIAARGSSRDIAGDWPICLGHSDRRCLRGGGVYGLTGSCEVL